MSDRTPVRLTWATSREGERFQKSGEYLTPQEPYEAVSARDPKVFMNRFVFAAFTTDGKGYGGNFIKYEAIQDATGDLTFRKPED